MPSGCPMSSHQHMADLVSSRLKAKGLWRRVSMAEVAAHNHKDDAWIVVEGKVYDITHHVQTHKGWTCGCATSTLLATLRVMGTDCTEEVLSVHSVGALRQLQPYMIGEVVEDACPPPGACQWQSGEE